MKLTEIHSDIEKILSTHDIQDYFIHNDGTVDVTGNVLFNELFAEMNRRTLMEELPIKFGTIDGDFILKGCKKLKSLNGSPHTVTGKFVCNECHSLTTLEGGPQHLKSYCQIIECNGLTSLKGAPKTVPFGTFVCDTLNNLTSLEHVPETIGLHLFILGCEKLRSLDFLPKSMLSLGSRIELFDCPNVKNYLSVFKMKGLKRILTDNTSIDKIVNKYLPTRDVIGCQDELIEAGFGEYARTK